MRKLPILFAMLLIAIFSISVCGAPNVTPNSPPDNNITNDTTIIFNCSAFDETDLATVTLYGNWSGSGWHANETNSSGINDTEYIFTKTLLNGTYEWNCYACDNNSNCSFASSNHTLAVESKLEKEAEARKSTVSADAEDEYMAYPEPETEQPSQTEPEIEEAFWKVQYTIASLIFGLIVVAFVSTTLIHRAMLKKRSREQVAQAVHEMDAEHEAEHQEIKLTPHEIRARRLRAYVERQKQKGIAHENIIHRLLDAGWKAEHLVEHLGEGVIEHINSHNLKAYIRQMLQKGGSIEHISHNLVRAGWDEDLIKRALESLKK